MGSVWSVSKLSTESVGSRRELVLHTADADPTKQFRRVGVGGVYWALNHSRDIGEIQVGGLAAWFVLFLFNLLLSEKFLRLCH